VTRPSDATTTVDEKTIALIAETLDSIEKLENFITQTEKRVAGHSLRCVELGILRPNTLTADS
jgi:hypothetical protein